MKLRSVIITIFTMTIVMGKLEKRALQKAHERSRIDKLMDKFLPRQDYDKTTSLAELFIQIFHDYLSECVPIILYDDKINQYYPLLEIVFQRVNTSFIHSMVDAENGKNADGNFTYTPDTQCFNYILIVDDIFSSIQLIDKQSTPKIVLITNSSQWRVNEFLMGDFARNLVNLLVIAPSTSPSITETDICYILYTHDLFVDGLGASVPKVLTSWRDGALKRRHVDLFASKMKKGFSGHRFITSVAHEPPYVIQRGFDENDGIVWDGIEIRLLKLLSQLYNFTIDIKNFKDENFNSPTDKIMDNINNGIVTVGSAGLYLTVDRLEVGDISYPYSYDCAAFISLTSTALPRYRAIMGPFNWTVWLCLTIVYLMVIFPLALADKLSIKHLLKNPEEMENMFWYVFGTFTNCFTFGKNTWTKSKKLTPRVLIGFYWLFTTIITACYTGSIIAFITLPLYPQTVDTVAQLLAGRYQVGTLDKGGWEYWFQNVSDPQSQKLLKYIEYLPDIESGLKNITKAFFWPYAFLGSRARLNYIVQTNFTTTNKRSLFHISTECFAPFGVGIMFAKKSIYKNTIDKGISYLQQAGFVSKFESDIRWDYMRSPTGKLLQASGSALKMLAVDDRSLALDDTQGMFLLLAAGFLLGFFALISETLGGCFRCFQRRRCNSSISSIPSNPRLYSLPTPRESIDSIQYSNNIHGDFGGDQLKTNIKDNNRIDLYNFEKYFGEDINLIHYGRISDRVNIAR